mmetsp:Transcript_7314/g.10210  ORF Transcript_7314/g.10210 Transcript_7314/m.10210 type:complete len:654 (-) Transcript_7314:442-2403(-)|eukprot:CAMPEP_0184486376 /NCGR_PEP_ID=MMETSP0113_2-20130426/7866_1 /TAXON_ID=91329 /ORGANISM="Norrisiella sphaerica, Strain BC52" /LENGTH=653 /DNA_ID=CAMNT_0026868211 /DNA_START=198 /DNA_END=2159 /DNA_ORIENTATION=+
MLRDIATAESCGQQNVLTGLANSLGKQEQQIADAKQFSGLQQSQGMQQLGPGRGGSSQIMNPAMQGNMQERQRFMQAFHSGPQLHRFQSAPAQSMQHVEANHMAKEFQAMNIQRQQVAQFERAFSGDQKGLKAQMTQSMTPDNAVANNSIAMSTMPPPMMQLPIMPIMAPISMQVPSQQMNVPTINEVQNLFKGVQAPKSQFVQKLNQESNMELQQERPLGGGGMGLSPEMINKLMQSDNPKWKNSKFLKFLNKVNNGEISFKDNKLVYNPKGEATRPEARDTQEQPLGMEHDLGDAWAAEFSNTRQADSWATAEESQSMKEWKKQFEQGTNGPDISMMSPLVDPKYVFQQDNKYYQKAEKRDNGEAFKEGLRLMKNGDLKEAIRAFEANVQYHPEHAEGWRYLGQCHADEEEERQAIAALLKCLECDPYNLHALMMLGVSYTNDLEEARALNYLKTWLENNPEYSHLPEVQTQLRTIREYEKAYSAPKSGLNTTLGDTVMMMFLAAVKANPKDAELHTVVGVLYHLSDNYDKAIEHFDAGCKLKPNDPYLWNKLGATLANSSRSRRAVGAYQKALALKPNYMRCRTNLSIAYANQSMHDKACIHYLKALRQNSGASHVWGYLKISLSSMGRKDLIPLVDRRDMEAFQQHFKF